jgi:hypothetical protein
MPSGSVVPRRSRVRSFTVAELERMRSTQDNAMQDTCVILTYAPPTDDYGNPDLTDASAYTAGESFECGVEMVSPDEVQASGKVPDIDAHIRMPLDTVISEADRVRVSHRYAENTDDVDYEVAGPVKRGPSGLVVECRKVVK